MGMRQVSAAAPIEVHKRYELVYQPIAITTPLKPFSEVVDISEDGLMDLYRWLDRVVQEIATNAINSDPGPETKVCPLKIS